MATAIFLKEPFRWAVCTHYLALALHLLKQGHFSRPCPQVLVFPFTFYPSTQLFDPSCSYLLFPFTVSLRSTSTLLPLTLSQNSFIVFDRQNLHHDWPISSSSASLRYNLQGLAVGLQETSSEMISLTIAVIVHEAIMSFRSPVQYSHVFIQLFNSRYHSHHNCHHSHHDRHRHLHNSTFHSPAMCPPALVWAQS